MRYLMSERARLDASAASASHPFRSLSCPLWTGSIQMSVRPLSTSRALCVFDVRSDVSFE